MLRNFDSLLAQSVKNLNGFLLILDDGINDYILVIPEELWPLIFERSKTKGLSGSTQSYCFSSS